MELNRLSVTSYQLVQVDNKIKLNWELPYIEPPDWLRDYPRKMGHINGSLIIYSILYPPENFSTHHKKWDT